MLIGSLSPQQSDAIDRAAELLAAGGLVAVPTETVYGLAADATSELAVRRIFAVKRRPQSHPLIVHLAEQDDLRRWASAVPEDAHRLASAFWPGPLTLVLPRARGVLDILTAGQQTVALRVPAHPVTRALLQRFGGAVAAPSANRFGRVSPTTASHVREDLDDEVDLILDGGPCEVGVESTIVDVSSGAPALLRPGGVSRERIEEVLGSKLELPTAARVRAPGQHPSHYAPSAGLVIVDPEHRATRAAALAREGHRVALLAPDGTTPPDGVTCLSEPLDPGTFARDLYALLREVDRRQFELLVLALPSPTGLGLALRDRLTRAASRPPPGA